MLKLSIIVPVYNEEKFIINSLKRLTRVNFGVDAEFVIVDDGSTDKTFELVKNFKKNSQKTIRVIKKENKGKGSALKKGIKTAKGDIVAFQDADLENDPQDLKILLKELLKSDRKTVICGSRFLKKGNKWPFFSYYLANKFFSFLTSFLHGKKITDMGSCYKMFYKSALKNIELKSEGFEIEAEITGKFLKKGLKIKEIPISYKGRTFREGKKTKIKDGLKIILTIISSRFI